jgi:1,4-alpha-glucan branching enzyme
MLTGNTQSGDLPQNTQRMSHDVSLLSKDDLYLFNEGKHYKLYQKMGAHPINYQGIKGTYFAVWAPNVSLVTSMGGINSFMNLKRVKTPESGKVLSPE